jgi:hypothetical protein
VCPKYVLNGRLKMRRAYEFYIRGGPIPTQD